MAFEVYARGEGRKNSCGGVWGRLPARRGDGARWDGRLIPLAPAAARARPRLVGAPSLLAAPGSQLRPARARARAGRDMSR